MLDRIERGAGVHLARNLSHSVAHARCNQLFPDRLCGGKKQANSFSKIVSRITTFLYGVYGQMKNLFRKMFCCFSKSKELTLLDVYKNGLTQLESLPRVFARKRKDDNDPALKLWWKKAFYCLDPKIQKSLLIEDIMARATSTQNKRVWAQMNFGRNRVLATEFVVNLNEEQIDGETNYPKNDVPKLIENTIHHLKLEIDRLGKN